MLNKHVVRSILLASLIPWLLSNCAKTCNDNFEGYKWKGHKDSIIRSLKKQDIQYIEYGDTTTLIVPTDRYFLFNSPELNELCQGALNAIVELIELNPNSIIYIAGFTDEIGSSYHKKMLTQARAEAMLTYLWAHGIKSYRLHAQGYGDKHPVSPNSIIHGSAYNRRLEIQWFRVPRLYRIINKVPYSK